MHVWSFHSPAWMPFWGSLCPKIKSALLGTLCPAFLLISGTSKVNPPSGNSPLLLTVSLCLESAPFFLAQLIPTRLQGATYSLLQIRSSFFIHWFFLCTCQSGFSDPLHLFHLYLSHCQSLGCSPFASLAPCNMSDAAEWRSWYCPQRSCACVQEEHCWGCGLPKYSWPHRALGSIWGCVNGRGPCSSGAWPGGSHLPTLVPGVAGGVSRGILDAQECG